MTETAIHAWLNRDAQPADLYELLGRLRFDPDRQGLLAAIRIAYAALLPYQNHSEPRLSRRAVELQRELGRAEGTLSDPERLRAHHGDILQRLSIACEEARKGTTEPWNQKRWYEWLRQQSVHPDSFPWVASHLSLRMDETLVLDHCETEEDLTPAGDPHGFVLEEEQPGAGLGGSRPRVFGAEGPGAVGQRAQGGAVEPRREPASNGVPADDEEPISAIVLPSQRGEEPVSAILLPRSTTTARRRSRKSRQKSKNRWSDGLASDRRQQFLCFLLLAGLLLLGLLIALAVLSGDSGAGLSVG